MRAQFGEGCTSARTALAGIFRSLNFNVEKHLGTWQVCDRRTRFLRYCCTGEEVPTSTRSDDRRQSCERVRPVSATLLTLIECAQYPPCQHSAGLSANTSSTCLSHCHCSHYLSAAASESIDLFFAQPSTTSSGSCVWLCCCRWSEQCRV